jgi:hypothetical protein
VVQFQPLRSNGDLVPSSKQALKKT